MKAVGGKKKKKTRELKLSKRKQKTFKIKYNRNKKIAKIKE